MADFCLSGAILNPDLSLYLISGLKYAGIDYYNIVNPDDLYYTPIISFLCSLFFRLGYVDKNAIIIITSILCFSGYIGLYMFLKIRFNSLLSLTGAIIYGSTTCVIFNLCKGLIDIPALAISIWALYFAVLAIDDNPKYFLVSFPLLVISFFTKYISGFVLPVILLYYLMRRDFIGNIDGLLSNNLSLKSKIREYVFSDEFKYISISVVISAILTLIICKTLILDFGGHLSFFQQSVDTFNLHNNGGSSASVSIRDKSYYFDYFKDILFEKQEFGLYLADLLYGIFGISVIVAIINFIKNKKDESLQLESFKTKHFKKILMVLFVLLLIATFIGFKIMENNMLSNICFLGSTLIFHSILKEYVDEKCLSMTLLYYAFFMVYFIFLSLYSVKVFRYALPLVISFIFIIIWSLDTILTALTGGFGFKCEFKRDYSQLSNIILVILIVLFLASTLLFITPMNYERSNTVYTEVLYKGYCNDLADACNYIMETDPDYHSKTFASFYNSERTIRWYMNVNVTVVKENDPDLASFDNTTYLILFENVTMDNYYLLHNCGDFNIYYHY